MENGGLFVTVGTLNRLSVLVLYLSIGLICYFRLFPRLLPTARRLAIFFLVAQVLVIIVSLQIQPSSAFERWLWRLNGEWNIAATLASTQMALVGGVALATAWLAKSRPALRRFYLVAVSLVFLYMARDEYQVVHEYISNWRQYYTVVGLAVVAGTVIAAARSPRRMWIWYVVFLAGLAISASGAFVLEHFRHQELCNEVGILKLDGCLKLGLFEEYLELSGMFLVLVAMLGWFSELPRRPSRRIQRMIYVLPALWIVLLVLTTAIIPIARQAYAQPAAVEFEADVDLHAFHIERGRKHFNIHLFLSPGSGDFDDLGYSIHLVDQVSGDSIVSRDKYADVQLDFFLAPDYVPVYRQWLNVEFPPRIPVNRAMWIILTLWREQGADFVRQQVWASDLQQLDETQVVLGELVIPDQSTVPTTGPLARFDSGYALEAVELPQRALPGESLNIRIAWRSDVASSEDLAQFLHFVHEEDGTWWGYDQNPLGARLPTRLWYDGLADSETWQVPLPADLAPGRYNVFTGLYRTRNLERIPARRGDGDLFGDNRVPLGTLIVER